MKYLSLFFCFGLLSLNAKSISLYDAIQAQNVRAVITSTGQHSGPCINLNIQNLTNKPLEIEITPGSYLDHEDSTTQDHLVTENVLFVLKPLEKTNKTLNALCCEKTNGCPNEGSFFTLKPYNNNNVKELCALIGSTKQFAYSGQEALWCLIRKDDPNYIDGDDSAGTMLLRNYVGRILKKEIKPFNRSSYTKPAMQIAENLSIETTGNHFVRDIKANDKIEYALYNEEGGVITDVKTDIAMENEFHKHNVQWHFTAENLNPDKKYYLRIKVNGVTYKEWMYKFMG